MKIKETRMSRTENDFNDMIPVFNPIFRNRKRAKGFRSLVKLELLTTK